MFSRRWLGAPPISVSYPLGDFQPDAGNDFGRNVCGRIDRCDLTLATFMSTAVLRLISTQFCNSVICGVNRLFNARKFLETPLTTQNGSEPYRDIYRTKNARQRIREGVWSGGFLYYVKDGMYNTKHFCIEI